MSSKFSELIGGKVKYAVAKIYHNTEHAPYSYWCFCLEFVSLAQNYLSRDKLGGLTPYSRLKGNTPDIYDAPLSWESCRLCGKAFFLRQCSEVVWFLWVLRVIRCLNLSKEGQNTIKQKTLQMRKKHSHNLDKFALCPMLPQCGAHVTFS